MNNKLLYFTSTLECHSKLSIANFISKMQKNIYPEIQRLPRTINWNLIDFLPVITYFKYCIRLAEPTFRTIIRKNNKCIIYKRTQVGFFNLLNLCIPRGR